MDSRLYVLMKYRFGFEIFSTHFQHWKLNYFLQNCGVILLISKRYLHTTDVYYIFESFITLGPTLQRVK